MKFFYRSITEAGLQKEGELEAEDKFALAHNLKTENETLLFASEIKNKTSFPISFFSGVKTHEKIIFARNLASMIEAGLPISRAISVLERQSKNQNFKKILSDIGDQIKKGKTFSNSLRKYDKIFPEVFVSMVSAGEESGKLADSLNVVASQMETTYLLQKKIKGALIYPSIILLAMLGIGIFMLVYIVPTLTNTFKEVGADLPASTQFIIWLSESFQSNMLLLATSFIGIIFLIIIALRTKEGKRAMDFMFLNIPGISPLVKETNSARTTRTLSSLLSAGVSVVDALDITKNVLQNSYYKEVIEKAKKNVEIGAPLADVFEKAEHLYPVFVGEMVAVGEETGDLGGMLLKVAIFYETEVEQKTKDMSTIIEPVLMLIVGVAVGFFALSMISPIYSIADKM